MTLRRKTILLFGMLFFLSTALYGCASVGVPVSEDTPSATLPPADAGHVAPIGDASLEYTAPATLYLPRHDGMRLTALTAQVSCSPTRPDAESIIRALLNHPGDGSASPVGGSVRLSLYGVNPVEVSGDVATVNLAANALQLSRESLFLACQAITDTLTALPQINYVNVLVVDKPVGLDIANTLPMGALAHSSAEDVGAAYDQLLSRRVEAGADPADKPFSSNVTLYFPIAATEGIASEVRTISFTNQVFSDMVVTVLRELARGPAQGIDSPALPLLAELLTTEPVLLNSDVSGGSIISLSFAYNLDDMLEAYGLSRAQSMASLCYTLCTFFPNVSGIRVSISDTPIDSLTLEEETDVSLHFPESVLLRPDFSAQLYDYCTLFFANESGDALQEVKRPIPYVHCANPRVLLAELSRGPVPSDSEAALTPVMMQGTVSDTDILGIAFAEDTLLVNFAPSFSAIGAGMTEEQERLFAYAIVNTLCEGTGAKRVCIFQAGSQFDGFSGGVYWRGLFYPMPI